MPITLKDVAERAGVSRSAVSRTFTLGASVSPSTRAKVERAARDLGYVPSALASALSTGRTKLIGLVVSNFRNPVFLEVFDRFTRGLQARGLRSLLVNLSDETDPAPSVEMLRRYSVDAVIVASSTLPPTFATAFQAGGLRVVHAFGRPGGGTVPVVGIDNVACGEMAARTLVARGYQRIGFLGGPEAATSTQDRLAGFRTVVPEARTAFAAAYSHEAGHAEMTRLLARGTAVDGWFCGDDILSIGALAALRGAGIAVPDAVGVIGLNDMEMAGWPGIELTTIRQPVAAIVDTAIELAAGDAARAAVLPPCEIVERRTLRPLP